jgi:ribosomal protein S8E
MRHMVQRQSTSNAFTFVRVAALRTEQLTKGCIARVPASHRHSITAQLEVAAGKIAFTSPEPGPRP